MRERRDVQIQTLAVTGAAIHVHITEDGVAYISGTYAPSTPPRLATPDDILPFLRQLVRDLEEARPQTPGPQFPPPRQPPEGSAMHRHISLGEFTSPGEVRPSAHPPAFPAERPDAADPAT